ncbi:MAG: Alanine dehydrogenase [Chlamydiales bacterium]|nr:Alanine dehydrogenase [Chlamydiales bacterium]MCH9619408.1 Alanine dehydrogenase [Chlamydiales bacterium]MCH9622212.1 Alanine dehydrogenase [Chlamydiales bacterium]
MLIGIPKECKNHEYRVGGTPSLVSLLVQAGHEVTIQSGAGDMIGYDDEQYIHAGAKIVPTMEAVYEAEMILKVKEPQKKEYSLLKKGQILFCYLHLAPLPDLTKHLLERGVVGIAFETITDSKGQLPLLTPMSEVAGRIAIQAGATALQMAYGGKGLLLGGVPGVPPAKVVIIGGGVVGTQVARIALGFGADVTVLERRLSRLRELDDLYGPSLKTIYSTPISIEETVASADLVVGAVLIPGKSAPKVITEEMIKGMGKGSVFVDVAIDQGGCCETSRATTHSDPIYIEHGVVHYCVANIPGACARTSTQSLTNAIAPYVLELADKGYKRALQEDSHFRDGLNVCLGKVTNEYVAGDGGFTYHPPETFLDG